MSSWKMNLQQNKACHETSLLKKQQSSFTFVSQQESLRFDSWVGSFWFSDTDFLQQSKDVQVRLTCDSKLLCLCDKLVMCPGHCVQDK